MTTSGSYKINFQKMMNDVCRNSQQIYIEANKCRYFALSIMPLKQLRQVKSFHRYEKCK